MARTVLAILVSTGAWALLAVPLEAESVSFVDDLGRPIQAPLEACFVRDLETDCSEIETSGAPALVLQPFSLLRVEGPEHGPVTAQPDDLEEVAEGRKRLSVPRKARLRVTGLPQATVTLSLHAVADPEARRPSFRYDLPSSGPSEALFVPAGDHLAALTRRGGAPDLHAFSAPPGGTLAIRYRDRTGWSLALRTLAPGDGGPVRGSVVVLAAPPGGGPEAAKSPEARTDALGFALFSGLTGHMVHASVRHPQFVETEALGLSATPGAFDLYHVVLERGGTIEVRVGVDGEPPAGAACRIVEEVGRDERRNPIIHTVHEVRADSLGSCRLARVPEGERFVRVALESEGSAAVVDRDVYVVDGETAHLDLDLSPIHLSGTVFLGEERAGAGYRVLIDHLRPHGPGGTGDPSLSVGTDESGEYSGTLWAPSEYYLALVSPGGVAVETQRAFLSEPSEELDFHVSAREIRGQVVDQDGEPVEGAAVALRWNVTSHVGTRSGSEGEFAFPLREEEGEARLSARRLGEPPGEAVSLSIMPGVSIPPVTLTLREPQRVEGRLLGAHGQPIQGGRVWSYRGSSAGAPTLVGRGATRADGRFEVPPAPDAPTWIYATGPGCPLSVHTIAAVPDREEVQIRCTEAPSALRLHLLDPRGDGLAGRSLILRFDGKVIPHEVLQGHLASLGLPVGSDGRGRLVLGAVSPGAYDLYLRDSSNEATVAQGLRYGFVASTTLRPFSATDLEIVVDEER